jgi:undecaprenyl-diphosphatase
MARLPYRTFALYNVAGGVLWAALVVMLGYLGGTSWKHVEHLASRLGLAALALFAVVVLLGFLVRRSGSGWARGTAQRMARSSAVRRTRTRFPRTSTWVVARFDPGRGTGLPLSVSVAVAVAAVWVFAGVTQDVVAHEELATLDPTVHAWAVAHRTAFLTGFFRAATWLGAGLVTIPVLIAGGTVLARRRHSWRPLAAIAIVYGAAVLAHAVVELGVRRPRPPRADWLSAAQGWSYPSGHTTQAVAAWGILALLAAQQARGRTRFAVVAGAVVMSAVVAASRVYLGVHWLTDVLGGAALSVAVLATWSVLRLVWRRAERPAG